MSARRHDQPFTRGSTFATVMVVIFVVGTIAIGVAYLGNREWGDPQVATSDASPVERGQLSRPSQAPAGAARPAGPLASELRKAAANDPWPTLKAPTAPELLAEPGSDLAASPHAAADASESPLPQPSLLTDGEGNSNLAVPAAPLLDGPVLAHPYDDLAELGSPLADDDKLPAQKIPPAEQSGAAGSAPQPANREVGSQLAEKPRPDVEEAPSAKPQPDAGKKTEVAKVVPNAPPVPGQRETLLGAAESAGTFGTFLKLARAADLQESLDGETFYTVIAPTDKAFDALPAGTVAALLQTKHRDKLESLLAYHLIPGDVSASALSNRRHVATLNGQRLRLDTIGVGLTINGAPLAMPSIACRNGMLHGVDKVLLPVADNLSGVLEVGGDFAMLRQLLEQADLQDLLTGQDELTLFAPTDAAFESMPTEVLSRLVQPENRQLLKSVLLHHLAEGRIYGQDLLGGDVPRSLEGLPLDELANAVRAGKGQQLIAEADLEATNGVVHRVNRVIMPPQVETTLLKPIERTAQSPVSSPRQRWQTVLEQAVADGQAAYRDGDHAACADLYEDAIQQLLQSTPADELPQAREALLNTLTAADRQETAQQRAWVLRRGINQAYGELFATSSRTGN